MVEVDLKADTNLKAVKNQLYQGQQAFSGMIDLIENLQVKVDFPGIDENDLDISFNDGILTIAQKTTANPSNLNESQKKFIAVNRTTQMALALAERMAFTDDPVVIYGAIGTGKHLIAQTIHGYGTRKEKPFVMKPCGTSHTFTEICDKTGEGTLYLDDLDEMGPDCLDIVRQIGSQKQKYPFRLIVAVDQSREELNQQHVGLAELLSQLRSCVIELPQLAERVDEIESLVVYHLERIRRERELETKIISPEFIHILKAYPWPGNIRELINTLDQVMMTAGHKKTLFARDLPNHIRIQTQKTAAKDKKGL
jgi:two-component system, NtrC family, response regulator